MRLRHIILALVCLATLCASGLDRRIKKLTPIGADRSGRTWESHLPYDGIDVARYQKGADWAKIAADKNIKYAYIKATEGAKRVDECYTYHLNGARKHHIKVGSYHFFSMKSSVTAQFANFKRTVHKDKQDLIPMIDVELKVVGFTRKQLQDSVKAFADLIREHYGCEPLIYVGMSYFTENFDKSFADYKLFIPRYSGNDDVEPVLAYGAKWTIWQFTQEGRIPGIDGIPGIEGNVDLSCLNDGVTVNDLLIKNNPVRNTKRQKKEEAKAGEEPKKEVQASAQERREEAREKSEREKIERFKHEKAEREKAERAERDEKAEKEKAKAEKEARQKTERELKAAKQKAEKEKKEREKAEKEKAEKAQKEREKAEKEKAEKEKKEREKAEKEKKEREKAEKEKARKQKAEQQRAERDDDDDDDESDKATAATATAAANSAKAKVTTTKAKTKKAKQPSTRDKQRAAARNAKTAKKSAKSSGTKRKTNKSSADNDD